MASDAYVDLILDHYRNPRHKGRLERHNAHARDSNPFCGDVVEYYLRLEDGRVADVAFEGKGCAISQAAASILSELVQGKSIEEVRGITKEVLLENMGLPELGPVRIKCALLPLKVLKLALYGYLGSSLSEEAQEG
ncbi:MAG: SUF system NifU family Fe-S cluster assembly protein [Nitrososphaerota archaeon]